MESLGHQRASTLRQSVDKSDPQVIGRLEVLCMVSLGGRDLQVMTCRKGRVAAKDIII